MLRRAPAAPDAAVGPQTSLGWRRRALNRSPTQCEDDRGTRPGDNEKSPRAPSIVIQRSIGWRGGRGLTLADTGLDGGELNARMLDGLRSVCKRRRACRVATSIAGGEGAPAAPDAAVMRTAWGRRGEAATATLPGGSPHE